MNPTPEPPDPAHFLCARAKCNDFLCELGHVYHMKLAHFYHVVVGHTCVYVCVCVCKGYSFTCCVCLFVCVCVSVYHLSFYV